MELKTHIDILHERSKAFIAGLANSGLVRASEEGSKTVLGTGTTVVGMLSVDKKVGIVASDGRALTGTQSLKEDFRKVFDCRIGFIGAAGGVGIIQMLMKQFREDLNQVSNSRSVPMTATGATGHLFRYYYAVMDQVVHGDFSSVCAFLPLFWDSENRICHLYSLEGGSRLSHRRWAAIGSGSHFIRSILDELSPATSSDELLENARTVLRKAARQDKATNVNVFYGIIDNGKFRMSEEILDA